MHSEIYRVIATNPGVTNGNLARMIDSDYSTVRRRVDRLEFYGFFVYEDAGRLYPFRVIPERDAKILWNQTRRG